MIEPRIPKYQWGQRVKALIDLHNDGSFPNKPADAMLVGVGDT
jgi:nitrogen fixation protein NifZ